MLGGWGFVLQVTSPYVTINSEWGLFYFHNIYYCFFIMGLAVTFLSGTFLSSIQKRGKGGDSDLEPIDSWLITQGMVRGHQLS